MTANRLSDPNSPDDLLATKLEIPLVSSCIVPRRRLTDVLKTGMERRLTTLTAPTGYGKTTLLAEWLSGILLHDWRVVWVTVDSFDNEPFRLWSYIAAGLSKAYPRLHFDPHRWFRDQLDNSRFAALTRLINEIAQIPYRLVLVLDDYQWITADVVHQEIRYLLDHQPKNLHLLISSRVTPPFHLSRLRAQRQLIEVTSKDLSFTLQEASNFFACVMKVDLDQAQATALHTATEGWIAGLQLATVSLQGRPDRQSFIDSLPGGNRQIYEYLIEEVLDQQDPAVRDFLLKTSILSEFCAPLCDAILEQANSRELLNRVQQANLFVVPLDERQYWYSYHRLFADTLQRYLRDSYPELISELHRRACQWLQQNGYPDKAVSHALAYGDLEQAASILDACAMQAVIGFNLAQLSQWIGRFSDDLISQRPQLGIYHALANYLLQRFEKAEQNLSALEQILNKSVENGIHVEDEAYIRWEIAVLRSSIECFRGDDASFATIIGLMQNPPEKDVYFYGFMFHYLAEGYAVRGDLAAAVDSYVRGCQFALDYRLVMEYCYSLTELAFVRKMQGHLRDAERDYLNLLEYAQRFNLRSDVIAFGKTGLADIALEQNRMEQASGYIQWVIDHFNQIETSPLSWLRQEWLLARLAKYSLEIRDLRNAQLYFEKAMVGFRGNRQIVHYICAELIDIQVRIWSLTGELASRDLNFLEQITFLDPLGKSIPAIQAAKARYALAQGNPGMALRIFSDWVPQLQEAEMNERLIEAEVIHALAWQATGNLSAAMQALHQALSIAAAEGYRRFFTDEGSSMKTLLELYCQQPPADEERGSREANVQLARSLIAELGRQLVPTAAVPADAQPATNLVYPLAEPLSQREAEILRLVVAGKTTKEIAVALAVSLNTTKAHMKSLYRKLGAHTRAALLQRAKDLGMAKSTP
jgi:LuxR family transcriptional regulator, maltose regulon positive regulatory protein